MTNVSEIGLKFPCDCFTESKDCEEPWALIAKRGIFKGGTRERILNLIHEKPRTLAQLSKSLGVSQPTIHRHLSTLISGGLITDSNEVQKNYAVERYYKPTFPVITEKDQKRFSSVIEGIAENIVKSFSTNSEILRNMFQESDAERSGWKFEEIAQHVLQAAGRKARRTLEEKDVLAANLHDSREKILFWATEE